MVEMVKELTEFKWSSYRSYAGYAPVPEWLSTEAVMNWVPARTRGAKREQYRQRFLEMIGAGDLGTTWKESLAGNLVLGGRDFVERVRKMLAGNRNEQKALREMEKPPVDWDRITSAIEELWRKTLERSQWAPRRSGTRAGNVDCPAVRGYEFTRDR
jgi:hypothetical protein